MKQNKPGSVAVNPEVARINEVKIWEKHSIFFEYSQFENEHYRLWYKTNLVTLLQIQKSREILKWKFVKSQREFRITI